MLIKKVMREYLFSGEIKFGINKDKDEQKNDVLVILCGAMYYDLNSSVNVDKIEFKQSVTENGVIPIKDIQKIIENTKNDFAPRAIVMQLLGELWKDLNQNYGFSYEDWKLITDKNINALSDFIGAVSKEFGLEKEFLALSSQKSDNQF